METLRALDADILVLTETDICIDLGSEYEVRHSEKDAQDYFRAGERRVSIFSKYAIGREMKTFRSDTSLCVVVATPKGALTVYGTVIGTRGNRGHHFKEDLQAQLLDFNHLGMGENLCVAGDFNISFGDAYYTVKESRQQLEHTFSQLDMNILTRNIPENIDHIALSNNFTGDCKTVTGSWNDDKVLSDHKGIWVEIML